MKGDYPLIALTGPTAAGKTGLALALAERYPLEIINVDSALVYRDMEIGTAKPGAGERARVAHHLIDLIDPTEAYSAGRFYTDARAVIQGIRERGRIPLLVGGTLLYLKTLMSGLSELPAASAALRARMDAEAAALGWPALHARLAAIDPASAARIQPRDKQRIQRALEVHALTGQTLSALWQSEAHPAGDRPRMMAILPADRGVLHARIETRFRAMVAAGLLDELRGLRARYPLRADMPSMRCVGYRQAWACLEGEYDETALIWRGVFATRQLAKRQLTGLRSLVPDAVIPLEASTQTEIACRQMDLWLS
jgi:tRNA dimethylallyltransferase